MLIYPLYPIYEPTGYRTPPRLAGTADFITQTAWIERLSDELLTEIFRYMSGKGLAICREVFSNTFSSFNVSIHNSGQPSVLHGHQAFRSTPVQDILRHLLCGGHIRLWKEQPRTSCQSLELARRLRDSRLAERDHASCGPAFTLVEEVRLDLCHLERNEYIVSPTCCEVKRHS